MHFFADIAYRNGVRARRQRAKAVLAIDIRDCGQNGVCFSILSRNGQRHRDAGKPLLTCVNAVIGILGVIPKRAGDLAVSSLVFFAVIVQCPTCARALAGGLSCLACG